MNRLAVDLAPIGRLDEEPLRGERRPRVAPTHAIPAGPENRWELRRSAFPKPRRVFQGSPSPR